MKTLTNIFVKVAFLAAVVLPMLTSCYDDKAIWDKFDDIENRLDSLENSLNQQFQALNTLISSVDSKTTVTSCDKNSDGSYDVTLSNGAKFTVLPDGTDYSALVSVVTVNGVKCWATYDENGKLIALTDDAGQPVPVVPVVDNYRTKVEVLVEDGVYYLVIDGVKYKTGYDTEDLVQVFSSCTPLEDASGNVYAMQFTFGEGMTVTVALDGYNGVIFKLPNALSSSVVSEYFVAKGATETLLLDMAGVVDYIMQIPDGWRVDERVDEYTGETYIDITAPTAEAVANGYAVENGDLKVVAVVEGGKAAVSRLALSTEAFKVFDVNSSKAVLTPYTGVQKYVYGVCMKSEYDEAALLTKIEEILKTTGDFPAGFVTADGPINANHTDTFGGVLSNNVEYIFWAVPALYTEEGNGGFYVKAGNFKTYTFSNITVKFEKTTPALLDAEIEVTFNGVSKIYGGTVVKNNDTYTEIVRLINNGAYPAVTAPQSYKGAASAFPTSEANATVEFAPGTTYVSWVVPAQDGKTNYTVNDIVATEFTTNTITSGSSLKVTFGETKAETNKISIPVSSEGAEMLYYVYMSKSDGDRIANVDNDTKAELIIDNASCVAVKGSQATAKVEKVAPKTTMWLYAVAVDKNGKYGTVNSVSATTGELSYNNLSVAVSEVEVSSDYATFKIEVTGGEAEEIIYWVGKSNDDFWVNPKYLGGAKEVAQQYLALYPDDANIVRCMARYGAIAEDGTLKVTGLERSSEYIMVAVARDKNGVSSQVGYKMVVTLAADLGNIVREGSAEWNAAKEAVKVDWLKEEFSKGQEYPKYAFNFSCPTNMTAFILCGSDEYFTEDPKFEEVEARMIEIESVADRKRASSPSMFDENGDWLYEPDWYDCKGEKHSGGMAVVGDYYTHGNPYNGSVTYLAQGICGENCPNYQSSLADIQKRLSIDYYIEKFSGYWAMENDEAAINKAAQELLDFYRPFFENKKPIIFENTGSALKVIQPYGIGADQTGKILDDVFIVLKDANGNYYEPMKFEVPPYFK